VLLALQTWITPRIYPVDPTGKVWAILPEIMSMSIIAAFLV